jgi:hypothetical protein
MREIATTYTGQNISLTIGDTLVTTAFGVSWEVSQSKRPIYGYNSSYYDSVAKGQIIVLGQLFINFVTPNYLSRVLYRYYGEKTQLPDYFLAGFFDTLKPPIHASLPTTIATRGSKARQERLSDLVNALHNDPAIQANYGAMVTGGTKRLVRNDSDENRAIPHPMSAFSTENAEIPLSYNLESDQRRTGEGLYRRPDNWTSNDGLRDPINIIVTYGDPGVNDNTGIMSYIPSSSIGLFGVHFIGEGQQIMADDQPIMETYKFMARTKETLVKL